MRLSTITICLFVFWTCLPAAAQEPIVAGQPQPVVQAAPTPAPAPVVSEAESQVQYDPATYNQWDPKSKETLYPAPGPDPAPPLGPCDQRTGLGYNCPKNWYVNQKVRIMYHPTTRAPVFSMYYDPHYNSLGTRLIYHYNAGKSGSLGMEPAAGYDITIGKYLGRDVDNRDQFVEFTYYGMNKWKSRFPITSQRNVELSDETTSSSATTQTTSGNLFSPVGGESITNDVSGFNRADTQTLEYNSRWDNFELNLRIKPRGRADSLVMQKNASWTREAHQGWNHSYLFGIRGITLDEYFNFTSDGDIHVTMVDGATVDYTANVGGRYKTKTRNDMFGLQIGMDCTRQKGPWSFGADVKASALINFADQHTLAYSWGADTDTTEGDPWAKTDVNFQHIVQSRDIAGILELGFMTSYQLRKNVIASIHYDLMWMGGMVLAPEQFTPQANAPARISNNGTMMMQSLSMGLEFLW